MGIRMIQFTPFTFNAHGKWIKNTIQCVFCDDTNGIVALRDGKPVAACICDNWTDTSVNVHFVIEDKMVLRHGLFEEFAYWVYITCGRDLMIGNVAADNVKALKLDKHIGFQELARIPDAYKQGVDVVLLTLHRKDCKYLPEELREAA